MRSLLRGWLGPVALSFLLASCGGLPDQPVPDDEQSGSPSLPTVPPLGAPITAPAKTWTWVNFPDAVCDDGSATGIGVSLNPASKDLLIFLQGGGACWDYDSCAVSNTSTHGPYGESQFNSTKLLFVIGSILDRNAKSSFQDMNMVYVPYCTGDVHTGDNVMTYDGGGDKKRVIHHKGRPNLIAFLKRIAATVPMPGKLVVTGSSAGGFGSSLNYDLVRAFFPQAKSYLLDDSGPPMVGDAIPADLRQKWYTAWRLDQTIGKLCPDCNRDFSTLVPILGKRYPHDRMGLLSYTQDGVIRKFFGNQSEQQFQQNLTAMAKSTIDPLPNFHYYFVSGTGHTFLFTPGLTTVKGVSLLGWISQLGSDDPKWTSVTP
ncbi:MAG TPA: pectin acetylesterase-family hydrolase [Pseudomonadota bacterium]|nr:pectin acetylesterase-family hydrolase [Pseudomonadota bacterium]HNK45970.1 pectin acetylesterase-family hydrolase [Pseudomonadota bacterium]HNN50385.1 pectin acetylesterase-family hydrolase [Pseudomonadota bacterium]